MSIKTNALTALILDLEMLKIFREKIHKTFKFYDVMGSVGNAELDLLMQGILLGITKGHSFGSQLMNIRYKTRPPLTKLLCLSFMIYLWRRTEGAYTKVERIWRLASIANLVHFFATGRYRNLIDRFVCGEMEMVIPTLGRGIAYEFMNQQLAWSSLSEFCLFVGPFVNFRRIKSYLFSKFSSSKAGKEACAICLTAKPALRWVANCGHSFCYFCVSAARIEQPNFSCPCCHVKVVSLKPFEIEEITVQDPPKEDSANEDNDDEEEKRSEWTEYSEEKQSEWDEDSKSTITT